MYSYTNITVSIVVPYCYYRSVSDSEESDDQTSWAQKRREIKSSLSPTSQGPERVVEIAGGSPNHTSLPLTPLNAPQELVVRKAHDWQTVDSKTKKRHQKTTDKTNGEMSDIEKKDSSGVTMETTVPVEGAKNALLLDVESLDKSPSASSDSALQSSSCSSIQSEPPANADNTVTQQTAVGRRNHTSGSFTVSSEMSSFSEGETSPTKSVPVAGIEYEEKKTKIKRKRKNRGAKSGLQDEALEAQKNQDSSPELGRAEFGAKKEEEKEGEGARKFETKKKEGGAKSKKKKKGDAKKKKPTSMRIRLDSLTTSSDEERGVDSPCLSRVEEVTEPVPESKEESQERLRQRLEHKILSKKPPAMFDTPATEPLFHKVCERFCMSMVGGNLDGTVNA